VRCFAGNTISCFMVSTAAVCTDFVGFTVGADMAILLTIVTADRFTKILQYCDYMALDENFIANEVVGSLRINAGDFHGGNLLIRSTSFGLFEPLG
jgi:hypothetical protein